MGETPTLRRRLVTDLSPNKNENNKAKVASRSRETGEPLEVQPMGGRYCDERNERIDRCGGGECATSEGGQHEHVTGPRSEEDQQTRICRARPTQLEGETQTRQFHLEIL